MSHEQECMNAEITTTIPMIWLHGEWCVNEGHNNGSYFVFRRQCGEAYFLSKIQLESHLTSLIFQF